MRTVRSIRVAEEGHQALGDDSEMTVKYPKLDQETFGRNANLLHCTRVLVTGKSTGVHCVLRERYLKLSIASRVQQKNLVG